MPRRVSMQSIADHLQLSKYTVSRALSGKSGVGEETRRAVLAAARALGYRLPPPADGARAARRSAERGDAPSPDASAHPATRYVLFWMNPAIQNESTYWARVLTGATAACRERGWEHAVVAPRLDGGQPFPAYMDREACVGHVAVGGLPGPTIAALQAMGEPLVLLDHEEPLARADAVLNANADAAVLVTNHLLRAGRRSFVFVGNDGFAASFRERWNGCRQAIESFGERGETRLRKWSCPYPERRWADEIRARLLAGGDADRPDAYVCANDMIALELLDVLHRLGRRLPDDCAVVGFDNIDDAARADPPLTTVELAKEELGRRAVEQLAARLDRLGERPEKVLLAPRLVVRASG